VKYKRVISFGDSFTWGNDLNDCKEYTGEAEWEEFCNSYSKKTWSALLANYFSAEYTCLAVAGSSNQTILRDILNQLDNITSQDFVIVNWSWIDRWDFYDIDIERWITVRPMGLSLSNPLVNQNYKLNNEYQKIYYTYFQSELWDKLESLKAISIAIDFLEKYNIKYFMTCVDPLIIDEQFHYDSVIKLLINNIKDKLFWFDRKGFYHWSKENKYPISDLWHPLEEAHQAAFEYIINNYEFT